MLYSKFRVLLGLNFNENKIPDGVYCYIPDIEKNKTRKDFGVYYTKPCVYYKTLGNGYNGCAYLGIITDDDVFDDQCKMCSIRNEFNNE